VKDSTKNRWVLVILGALATGALLLFSLHREPHRGDKIWEQPGDELIAWSTNQTTRVHKYGTHDLRLHTAVISLGRVPVATNQWATRENFLPGAEAPALQSSIRPETALVPELKWAASRFPHRLKSPGYDFTRTEAYQEAQRQAMVRKIAAIVAPTNKPTMVNGLPVQFKNWQPSDDQPR